MTTPRSRSLVSVATVLTVSLALGGCAGAPARYALAAPVAIAGTSPVANTDAAASTEKAVRVVRFDNRADDYVRVYLVDETRQWLLGRVEPGSRATLRVPAAALTASSGNVRLSVQAGDRTSRPTGEGRAVTMDAQPVSLLLAQRWAFSQTFTGGQITGLPLGLAETVAH